MNGWKTAINSLFIKFLLWGFLAVFFLAVRNVGYMGDTIPIVIYVGVFLLVSDYPKATWRVLTLILTILVLLKWQFYNSIPWTNPALFLVTWLHDLMVAGNGLLHGHIRLVNASIRTLVFYGLVTYGTWFLNDSLDRPWWFFLVLWCGEGILVLESRLYGAHDEWAMGVFLLLGLLVLAFSQAQRILAGVRGNQSKEWTRQFGFPALLALLVTTLSVILPSVKGQHAKTTVQEPNKAALLKQVERSYNSHNLKLGGPFFGSNQIMLKVIANSPSYYRGEVLTNYTGTGWNHQDLASVQLASGTPIPSKDLLQAGLTSPNSFSPASMTVEIVHGHYPVWFTGYLPTRLRVLKGSRKYTFNANTGELYGANLSPGDRYQVVYRYPQVSGRLLAGVRDGNLAYAFPQELELPTNFPNRDLQLARRITAHQVGTYAKIEAIIHYLQSHEKYQTVNVPYLKPGQDFVDQFLFVTHIGYCDHFSSALAVLARAVGIPTRWVRGYISVPPNLSYSGKGEEFLLRGTDAHSWAEVWFAGVGWVPFEATPSFYLPSSSIPNSKSHQQKVISTVKQKGTQAQTKPSAGNPNWMHDLGYVLEVLIILAIVAGLAWIFYRALKKRQIEEVSTKRLLLQFLRMTGGRRPQETLREMAQRVGISAEDHDMIKFIEWYEGWRYGKREVLSITGKRLLLLIRKQMRKKGKIRSPKVQSIQSDEKER